jgi:hypothetical protein
MSVIQDVDGLSECIGRAIQEHLSKSNINIAWPQLGNLDHPVLRVEAFLEEANPHPRNATRAQSERIASVHCSPRFLDTTLVVQTNVRPENYGSGRDGNASAVPELKRGTPGSRSSLADSANTC